MTNQQSLTQDLLEQVHSYNPNIVITDLYPLESWVFDWDELDVGKIDQMLPMNSTKQLRVEYVAADADDYDIVMGDVYGSNGVLYGRMLVMNQQMVVYYQPTEKRWIGVK